MEENHNHDATHHSEPAENEIAGPVIFALTILGLIITIIYFWAQ